MYLSNNTKKYQLLTIALFFATLITITFTFIDIFIPFILGFIFAYLLEPVSLHLIEKRGISKAISISIVLSAFFIAFFLFFYYLTPLFLLQIAKLLGKFNIQHYFSKTIGIDYFTDILRAKFPDIANILENSIGSISGLFFNFVNYVFNSILKFSKALVDLAAILLITPLLTFYFAFDMQKIKNSLKNLIPRNYKQDILKLFSDINYTLGRYLRGQLGVSTMLATYYSIALLSLSIKHAVILGIFSGISLFVPYLGIIFSFIMVAVLAFIQFKTFHIILYLLAVYICGHVMEGAFITPKLIGKSLNLHPLWIIFGLFLGGSLLGFFGVLFAIPLTAIVAVLIRFVMKLYKQSKLYKH